MTKSADVDPLLTGDDALQVKQDSLSSKKRATLRIGKLWAETRNELRSDLRSTRWRHTAASYFTWLGFTIWALGLVTLCLVFPLSIMETISLESSEYWNYCAPDGSFSLEPTNPWNPDWTFQIVLAFGSLSFSQSKVVDIVWDVVSSLDLQPVILVRPKTKTILGSRSLGPELIGLLLMEGILCLRQGVYGDCASYVSHILDEFHAK